jgi:hypothetical protein
MSINFQFGFEQYIYFGTNGANPPQPEQLGELTLVGGTLGANDITQWEDFPTIRDSGEEGAPNTVDVSTREDLRQGARATAITGTAYTKTFQIRYKPGALRGAAFGVAHRDRMLYELLALMQASSTEIAIMEIDNPLTTTDAFGFVGNWTVSLSQPRPLEDLVVVDVTATLASLYHAIRWTGSAWAALPALT